MPTLVTCKTGAALALALLLSSTAAKAQLDVFERPLVKENMIPAGSKVCATKDELDVRPVLLQGVRPLYPIGNNLSSQSGGALIRYQVGEDGKTTVTATETTGDKYVKKWFGNHAALAVGSWTFTPGLRAGAPVPVNCTVEFSFGFE